MRRIATGGVVLAALSCGCQSIRTPWDAPRRANAVEATRGEDRPADEGVPDSVMLRDQARGGFGDSPVGP